jgi:hypothetical protein
MQARIVGRDITGVAAFKRMATTISSRAKVAVYS